MKVLQKIFALRSMNEICEKMKIVVVLKFLNLVLKWYRKSVENGFRKCVGTLVIGIFCEPYA